jgi:hypothetical protein
MKKMWMIAAVACAVCMVACTSAEDKAKEAVEEGVAASKAAVEAGVAASQAAVNAATANL